MPSSSAPDHGPARRALSTCASEGIPFSPALEKLVDRARESYERFGMLQRKARAAKSRYHAHKRAFQEAEARTRDGGDRHDAETGTRHAS